MPVAIPLAILGGVLAVDSYVKGDEARTKAKEAQQEQKRAQEKMQSEQRANNATRQAEMQRKTYREERVRRARILQSSENTGVEGSSGEYGALGNLETQLSSTLGAQVGSAASTERMSGYAQENANAQFSFQGAQQDMSAASSNMSLGMSLFSAGAGGMGKPSAGTSPTPGVELGSITDYVPQ